MANLNHAPLATRKGFFKNHDELHHALYVWLSKAATNYADPSWHIGSGRPWMGTGDGTASTFHKSHSKRHA